MIGYALFAIFVAAIAALPFLIQWVAGEASDAEIGERIQRRLRALRDMARAAFPRPRRSVPVMLVILAMVTLPMLAHAANTYTVGELTFTYFDSGVTNIRVQKDGGVFVYITLTSAQTTSMRSIYGTPSTASGGSAGTEPIDGTDTLPGCAPQLGDLTD